MRLKVLSSGSCGNSYLLETKEETLIIEAGITYKRIQEGLDFDTGKVVGCLISHEHGDHSKAAIQLMKNGIDVYGSKGTLEELDLEDHYKAKEIKKHEKIKVGGFTVLPFDVQHDAKEPLGFLIQHKRMGKLLFITDTYYSKYRFKEVDHILVECNYKKEILDSNIEKGTVTEWLSERIIRSHFEIGNVKDFLRSSDLSKTKNIVLIHLSSQNSNEKLFRKEIEKATGRITHIAEEGLKLDISKEVF